MFIQYSVFETVTRIDPENGEIRGVLAESWTPNADMTGLDIKLREDVTFHSGRKMTSADVVFSFEQVKDPANAARTRAIADHVTSFAADGDHGLKLTFARPLPNIFDLFEIMPVIDRETFDDYAAGETVVGTGRFTWVSWTPDASIVLEKYADHWDAAGTRLDRIESLVIKDPTALAAALRSGRVVAASGLPFLDSRSLADGQGYSLVRSGGSSLALGFDVTRAPFEKKELRQAVHYAIDRNRISEQIHGGLAQVTSLPWREGTAGYDVKQGEHYNFDQEKARQLIAAAGAQGTEFEMVVPDIPESIAIFEIVQNNLSQVGLTAKSRIISVADYDQRMGEANIGAPAILMRNGNSFSPASALATRAELRATNNLFKYDTTEYTTLANAVTNAANPEENAKALTEFNAYFLEQAIVPTLVNRPGLMAHSDRVGGIVPTAQGFLDVSNAYLTTSS
ncbi:ABC transporter substrate-binding protein [Micromonospora sp. SH-82]|uniref:ABC transporter substrate-binding protein n=1 Tax=Micromonospora sp. SH-82 TaxID=3132938 RepID=UPI003EC13D65